MSNLFFTERAFEAAAPDEGELPESWTEAVLDELVMHHLSGEWGKAGPGGPEQDLVRVSVLRGTDFKDWEDKRGAAAAERWVERRSLAKRELRPGDLVVEASGGGAHQPVGRILLIDEAAMAAAKNPAICANFCRLVRLHREVSPAFVHLALGYQYLHGRFNEFQTQTTNIRNLDFRGFLAGVTVPLPPAAEQARIAERVGELTARLRRVRGALARVPAILKRLRQSVLEAACAGRLTADWRERQAAQGLPEDIEDVEGIEELLARIFAERGQAFERRCREARQSGLRRPRRPANLAPGQIRIPSPLAPPEVPAGWTLVPLQDLLTRIQQGMSVRATAGPRTGVPVLRMGNIRQGAVDLADLKYVERTAADVAAFTLARGDILFNRTNSPELVGKAAVFEDDREAVFASYLIRLTCDERLALAPYVCGWINSPWGRQWARSVRTDCAGQSNINAGKLLAMPVPLPPLPEQREIVRRVEAAFALAATLERRLEAIAAMAERLARTVLAQALRGELVPTEAELARAGDRPFEPGAALLERIHADRQAGGAGRRRDPWRRSQPVRRMQRRRRPVSAAAAASHGGPVRVRLADFTPEWILSVFRQVCWGAEPMTADELLHRVCRRLGFARLGKRVRSQLEEHLKTALSRRIVAREGERFVGATPTFARYGQEFLIKTLRSVMRRGTEYEVEDVVRAVAIHLGYSQVTPAMRERMERVLCSAIRCNVLGARGDRVWRKR